MGKKNRLAHEEARFASLLQESLQELGNVRGIRHIKTRTKRSHRKQQAKPK